MVGDYSCIFQFFYELCELVGYSNGERGNK